MQDEEIMHSVIVLDLEKAIVDFTIEIEEELIRDATHC